MKYEGAVVLETFSDKSFAEAAVSLLAAEGIEAFVHADDAGGELPNLDFARGVRLLVSADDEARANELLNAGANED
jgi:hypothetical protein